MAVELSRLSCDRLAPFLFKLQSHAAFPHALPSCLSDFSASTRQSSIQDRHGTRSGPQEARRELVSRFGSRDSQGVLNRASAGLCSASWPTSPRTAGTCQSTRSKLRNVASSASSKARRIKSFRCATASPLRRRPLASTRGVIQVSLSFEAYIGSDTVARVFLDGQRMVGQIVESRHRSCRIAGRYAATTLWHQAAHAHLRQSQGSSDRAWRRPSNLARSR